MDKSLEDIWKEIEVFKRLKPDEQKSELKSLGDRLEATKSEISANSAALKKAETELAAAEAKSESIKKEYSEARERRQNAVALGEDDKKIKVSISDLMAEQDLIEDRCIGLRRRIEYLTAEGDLLELERIETEKTILRFRLTPLVPQWNQIGEQLAGVLKQIIVLADQLGEPFSEFRTGTKTIFYSQWEGFECLAKLYLGSEIDDPKNKYPNGKVKDIFNMREFREELNRDREKTAEAIRKEM